MAVTDITKTDQDTTHMPKETAPAYDHIYDDVAKPNPNKDFSRKKKMPSMRT